MAEDAPAEKSAPTGTSASNKSWGTSFVLILLTLLVAVACVVALACTLTQTRVAALTIDGVAISIPKLDYVGRQWADNKADARALESLEDEILRSQSRVADAQATLTQMPSVADKVRIFAIRIANTAPELAAALGGDNISENYNRVLASKDRFGKEDPSLAKLIDDIEQTDKNLRFATNELVGLQVQLKEKTSELELLKKRVGTASDGLFNYIKPGLGQDKDARARIENAFYELSIDKYRCGIGNNTECGLVGGPIARGLYHILTLRPDLLTLCLVILMGILGSTLQITHSYFMKDEKQDIGGYFQRVAVGAMTALVIFIVAKAGIPVIADTSRLGGDAPINPYLISFLAIISGLLSENAIANIQAQGRRYFGADGGGPKRWARQDYAAALEKQNMSTEALAGHLGVDKPTAEAMLKGSASMDAQQQKLFALCLRDDPRSIFTDIAPPASAAVGT